MSNSHLIKQRCLENFPGVETRKLLLPLFLLLPLVLVRLCDQQQPQQGQGGDDASDQEEAGGGSGYQMCKWR